MDDLLQLANLSITYDFYNPLRSDYTLLLTDFIQNTLGEFIVNRVINQKPWKQ